MPSGSALCRFRADEYLVVDDLIDVAAYLDPMVDEYSERLDMLCHQLHAQRSLSSGSSSTIRGPTRRYLAESR